MAKPKKIILANDNSSDIELAKKAFADTGLPIDVDHITDGQDLLNFLRSEYLGNIALVLLDLDLPKVNGLDVLKIMYTDDELKKLPVIVFSNSMEEQTILECYEYGANAYVCKPSDVEEFNETINAIANFWGEINVLPSYNGHEVL